LQPPIQSGDLLLRAFEDSDAPAFAEAVRESVETVGLWMPWCHPAYTEHEALDWFAVCRADLANGSAFEYGVFSAETGAFIGGAALNLINHQHRFCNLGYWIRQSMQRRGIASHCVQVLTRHAFETLEMMRVEIVVAVGNAPSEGVARKAGGMFECVARNRLMIHDVSMPASIYSFVPDNTLR
jgi:ribosomal-protein-serine acetyltransferase